jgi:hypothetical protein
LIPKPQLRHGDFGAHHHSGRNDEHVDHRVLEPLSKENENRHVGAGNLADGRRGGHGRDHGKADHPIAEDRLDEHGDHARQAQNLVAGRFGLGDGDNLGGYAGRRRDAEIGERDRQQPAVDDAADQVAEKNPTPVG